MGEHNAELDKVEREAMTDAARFDEACVFRGVKTMVRLKNGRVDWHQTDMVYVVSSSSSSACFK